MDFFFLENRAIRNEVRLTCRNDGPVSREFDFVQRQAGLVKSLREHAPSEVWTQDESDLCVLQVKHHWLCIFPTLSCAVFVIAFHVQWWHTNALPSLRLQIIHTHYFLKACFPHLNVMLLWILSSSAQRSFYLFEVGGILRKMHNPTHLLRWRTHAQTFSIAGLMMYQMIYSPLAHAFHPHPGMALPHFEFGGETRGTWEGQGRVVCATWAHASSSTLYRDELMRKKVCARLVCT